MQNGESRMKIYSHYFHDFSFFIFHFSFFVVTLQRKKKKEVKKRLIYASLCLLWLAVVTACKSAHYCNCG